MGTARHSDGPLKNKWLALAIKLDFENRCTFYGRVTRSEALKIMGNCHVLVISSLRDITSTVLIEGMTLGLPVVCLNHCGFRDIVNESNGIAVSVESPEVSINQMASAIASLASDESKRFQLGSQATKIRQKLSWERKAALVMELYARIV